MFTGIYLEHGKIKTIGKAPNVAEQYIKTMREEMNAEQRRFIRVAAEFAPKNIKTEETLTQSLEKSDEVMKQSDEFDKRVATFRYGSGGAKITYVELLNMSDEPIKFVEFNQEVKYEFMLNHRQSRIFRSISILGMTKR